jgi:uncharacterized protein (UPF0335 family)
LEDNLTPRTLTAAEVAAKHNGSLPPKHHNQSGQLQSYIERFENLAQQMADLRDDQKELSQEAKSNGFEPAAIKAIVKRRMESAEQKVKREARESTIDTYMNALGMVD